MEIAIVGGGINGICIAWQALKNGHHVTLFERGKLMNETSSKSSKLLHGGLRYLENSEFRLVREALKEREFWLEEFPDFTCPLQIYLPIYRNSRRPAWLVRFGLVIYDVLAGSHKLAKHCKESLVKFKLAYPAFNHDDLVAVYTYYDGQMDDKALGLWLADCIKEQGAVIRENTNVERLYKEGSIELTTNENLKFDKIINVAGPWSEDLLKKSNIKSDIHLDLVRGSHIIIDNPLDSGFILEIPNERRVFFVLPYNGQTLVGTTEVRQEIDKPIKISNVEKNYLLKAYQYYFRNGTNEKNIIGSFAGLRPLLLSHGDPNRASREYAIEQYEKIITVFGGKWTTSRALGKEVVSKYL